MEGCRGISGRLGRVFWFGRRGVGVVGWVEGGRGAKGAGWGGEPKKVGWFVWGVFVCRQVGRNSKEV